jgi:Fic family protein
MQLLSLDFPEIDSSKMNQIELKIRTIYRLIIFSRKHQADDLLDAFLSSTQNLKELLSLKNAQMEAQNDEEALEYLKNLNEALVFVTDQINENNNFTKQLQLFQLFRLTAPEAHLEHPNRFRDKHVQIGSYMCPEPSELNALVEELFYKMQQIKNPIYRAIYFHHELIRIHPFVDGNGRTTRIAKNWMLMYNLYPPIFVKDEADNKEYIETLSLSFHELEKNPEKWNIHTEDFFKQEINRIYSNTDMIYNLIQKIGNLNRN